MTKSAEDARGVANAANVVVAVNVANAVAVKAEKAVNGMAIEKTVASMVKAATETTLLITKDFAGADAATQNSDVGSRFMTS